eukprot:COSAG01_NODE_146_length_24099_cov_25.341208_8_plen_122_part_00
MALRITYALQFHAALSPSSRLSWLLMRSCPSCRPPAVTIDGRRPAGRLPSCRRAAFASTTASLAWRVHAQYLVARTGVTQTHLGPKNGRRKCGAECATLTRHGARGRPPRARPGSGRTAPR